jgi:tetratricopeptide (TPR) repeat protein
VRKSLMLMVILAGPASAAFSAPARGGESEGNRAEDAVASPDPGLPVGKVLKKVVTAHDPEQSYALYLPTGYDPARKWPILYAFSPGAIGENPVRLFRAAAEKYGWIVAGSNNSRNGPREPIEAAIAALLKDTEARLAIGRDRRYTTGFSGGARVGFRLAIREEFAGTIPVGAGTGGGQELPAAGKMVVFSMCGTRCFNHAELLRLEPRLTGAGIRNRMATFDGGHQWAPREMCGAALRYMELLWQLKAGEGKSDRVKDILQLELRDAEKLLESPGQFMRGHARLVELAELTGDAALAARRAEVEAGEKYVAEKALSEELEKLRGELAAVADPDRRFEESVRRYLAFIDRNRESDAAARLTVRLQATARATAMGAAQLMAMKRYPQAEVFLRRVRLFVPKDKTVAYNLACALARNGKKEEALKTLAESVKLGFDDFDHIRKDPDLESLRDEPGFGKILESGEDRGAEGAEDAGGEALLP